MVGVGFRVLGFSVLGKGFRVFKFLRKVWGFWAVSYFWVQRVSQEAYGALKGFWDVLLLVGVFGAEGFGV